MTMRYQILKNIGPNVTMLRMNDKNEINAEMEGAQQAQKNQDRYVVFLKWGIQRSKQVKTNPIFSLLKCFAIFC